PRGGVVVGAQVASRLGLPLDVIIPRKIGAPHNPEVAVGAVAQDGTVLYDYYSLAVLGLKEEDLRPQVEQILQEIDRRLRMYRGDEPLPNLGGRTVILTDDGIATGYTVLAALRSLRTQNPREIVLAVPVAPPETVDLLRPEVDEVVCLLQPTPFYAVGQFYKSFPQVDDAEVLSLLAAHKAPRGSE
ncbi:MAG: phosphoribosyltransferase, partial [Firmicutes bacterium]|nr:phosphoribosyltransferase [Bacillota bacterium]